MSDEKQALHDALRSVRGHVRGIVDGLSDDDLARPVLPSGWGIVNLVHHLARDVERWWFRAVMADDPAAWESFGDLSVDGWTVPEGVSPMAVLRLYDEEIRAADEVIDAMDLTTPPGRWPEEVFGDYRLDDLREVMLHVIQDTATHAGQLDAVRELIDGRQWMVL